MTSTFSRESSVSIDLSSSLFYGQDYLPLSSSSFMSYTYVGSPEEEESGFLRGKQFYKLSQSSESSRQIVIEVLRVLVSELYFFALTISVSNFFSGFRTSVYQLPNNYVVCRGISF